MPTSFSGGTLASLRDLEQYRAHADHDIFVIPRFAQDVLGVDPAVLQQDLEDIYPVRGVGDLITPGMVQWVDGDNKALRYRGNVLKRGKIWLQRGSPPKEGYLRYGYTGWQWCVLPATVEVDKCAEVKPVADRYDAWTKSLDISMPCANHYIVTKYADGQHNIGFHSDKAKDITPGSLITVVKTGAHGRPFAVCLPGCEQAPFFSEVLAPGTAVVMTLEANLATKHAVPVVEEVGSSGSIVFRSIATRVSYEQAVKECGKRKRAS